MILLIDNYDSFTYNIAHALGSLGQTLTVVRSDVIGVKDVEAMSPEAIVISPGPGTPNDSGISCAVIERFAGRVPILGVCLGHQCIAEVFGAKVVRGKTPVHGKTSEVYHDGRTIYSGLRNPFRATRYHSLVAAEETVAAPSGGLRIHDGRYGHGAEMRGPQSGGRPVPSGIHCDATGHDAFPKFSRSISGCSSSCLITGRIQ